MLFPNPSSCGSGNGYFLADTGRTPIKTLFHRSLLGMRTATERTIKMVPAEHAEDDARIGRQTQSYDSMKRLPPGCAAGDSRGGVRRPGQVIGDDAMADGMSRRCFDSLASYCEDSTYCSRNSGAFFLFSRQFIG